MVGRALLPAERRRSLALAVVRALAVAAAVAPAVACGSETEQQGDSQSGSAPTSTAATGAGTTSAAAPAPVADVAPTVGPAPQPPAQSAPPPEPRATPAGADPPLPRGDTSGIREFPSETVWEALRQCQSQGDYTFVHPSGEYFGAYQFTAATWDRLAAQRYGDLLGVLPSEAAPADQDRMAYYLWIESGHARWPACSHVFTGDQPSGEAAAPPAAPPPPAPGDPSADAGATPPPPPTPPPTDPATPTADDSNPIPEATLGGTGATTTTTVDVPSGDLPPAAIDPAAQPAIPPEIAGFPTPAQWEALRQCESTGNYRAVSKDGRFYGAYQFWPDTWDFVAGRNYPRLVGILPSNATPQDQTRMAYRLYEERGDQPWPVCGRHLRAGAEGGSNG